MNHLIEIIKGINPGKFIERELKKKYLTQRELAEETAIPCQTINAITASRRNLATEQVLKIYQAFKFEEVFLQFFKFIMI